MLNDKEQKIYEYIRECILNYNISPTVREICREVGSLYLYGSLLP